MRLTVPMLLYPFRKRERRCVSRLSKERVYSTSSSTPLWREYYGESQAMLQEGSSLGSAAGRERNECPLLRGRTGSKGQAMQSWCLHFRSHVNLQPWLGAPRPDKTTAMCQLGGGIHPCVVSLSLWEIKRDLFGLSLQYGRVYDGWSTIASRDLPVTGLLINFDLCWFFCGIDFWS